MSNRAWLIVAGLVLFVIALLLMADLPRLGR